MRAISGGHEADRRYVWYSLRGKDLDPSKVESLVGMAADFSFRRGEPKPRTGIPYSDSYWSLDSGLGPDDEFHDHLDALLNRLAGSWPAFVDLGLRYAAQVTAAIYCESAQGPLVMTGPDVLGRLSELNAMLGFDLYALAEDRVAAADAGPTRG